MSPRFLRVAALFAFTVAASTAAQAQGMFRAYLASYGNDANPCTVTAPCRLLPAALNAVANRGQIWILDSANFNQGTVNITKFVSIQAVPGQIASIVAVNGAPAILISNFAEVVLRNMAISNNAVNPGTDGVEVSTGSVIIENSVLSDLPGKALNVHENFTRARLTDTAIRNSGYGIYATSGATVHAARVQIANNAHSVYAYGKSGSYAYIYLTDSSVADTGLEAVGDGGTAFIQLTRVITVMTAGLAATATNAGNAQFQLDASSINGIATISGAGASIFSMGNNWIGGVSGGTISHYALQ